MCSSYSLSGSLGGCVQTHGATYTVDAEWSAKELVSGVNWVLNIADAADALEAVVAEWNYRNLDEVAAFDVRCAGALSGASEDGCCGLNPWRLHP